MRAVEKRKAATLDLEEEWNANRDGNRKDSLVIYRGSMVKASIT